MKKVYSEQNSLVNLSNSILKHYGVKTFHPSIPEIDDFIKDYQKIVVILLDGFGSNIINAHLKEKDFLRSNIILPISSVFPPTTVAATTSFLTGRYPIETGYVGWSQYIKELDINLDIFPSRNSQTREFVNYKLNPSLNRLDGLINKQKNKDIAHFVYDHNVDKNTSIFKRLQLKKAYKLVDEYDEGFVYCYFVSPDHYMHKEGTKGKKAHRFIKKMNRLIEKISLKNKDVLTLVIADHGMKDISYFNLNEHPDLTSLLIRPSCIESRAMSFFVQEGKNDAFAALFNRYYGNYFDLMTKEEVLKEEIFGKGNPSIYALDSIGDFVAIATDKYALTQNKEAKKKMLKAHHAGATKEELEISVIGIKP